MKNNEVRHGLIIILQNQSSVMINCPDFDTETKDVQLKQIFNVLAVLSLIIHIYTMYCIVFRSPAQMKIYRWYLLWHQLTSFFGDFWVISSFHFLKRNPLRLMQLQSQEFSSLFLLAT